MQFEYRTPGPCDNPSYCVEVATNVPGFVSLRDTTGRTVEYTSEEWAAFIQGVKNDEFDV